MNIQLTKWLIATFCILQSTLVYAYPPGLSSMDVMIKADNIDAKVTFALQDIEAFAPMDSDLDAEVTDIEREAAKPSIAKLLAEQLRIAIDGKDYSPAEPGQVTYDDQNNAHVEFHYQAAPKQNALLQSKFLAQLPDGHQQYLTIKDANGKTINEKMLRKNDVNSRYYIKFNLW
jgi:ABC-type antimicrobial peptide transport system permease subunit